MYTSTSRAIHAEPLIKFHELRLMRKTQHNRSNQPTIYTVLKTAIRQHAGKKIMPA